VTRRIALFAALVVAAWFVSPQAAIAATSTVSFAAAETTAAFGSNWVIEVRVAGSDGTFGVPVTAASGTVDIVVTGIAGTYASLPLQNGGKAYFVQPLSKPLLPAGAHTLTAIFNPSAGSTLSPATSAPATLTITPLAVDTTVTAVADPRISAEPTITAQLAGEYRDALGTLPAGVWSFTVKAADTDTPLFETRRVQDPLATKPVTVVVDARLRSSTNYTVSWTFEPVAELAGGLTITTTGTTDFRTPDGTIVTALATPVEWPLWAWILFGVLLLGLAAVVTVLLIQRRKLPPGEPKAPIETPEDVDLDGADAVAALLHGDAPPTGDSRTAE
jgi:hypothetical protein